MKRVFLHGFLAEGIGSKWDLMVDSPAEAIRAINCNTDYQLLRNLNENISANADIVVLKISKEKREQLEKFESSEEFDEDLLNSLFIKESELELAGGGDEIHFIPRVDGQVLKLIPMALGALASIGGAIAGALSAISFTQMAFMMVGSMLVAGIAASMFPPVRTNDQTMRTKSYMFGSRPNNLEQGSPVPVGYGMLKVGSNTLCFFGENKFLPGSVNNKTLESYTKFFMQDLLCEGPIEGFCDVAGNNLNNKNKGGSNWDENQLLQSIYINDMPVKNNSNELNFMPAEDDPVQPPRFSLGGAVTKETQAVDSNYNPTNSRIEYEPKGAGSALPGPKDPISGFYVKPNDLGEYGGAKAFTHAITDRNVGLVTLVLSSEGQYHNWTDQRVRRRWFRRKVEVNKGTDAVTMSVAVRLFDGTKFISPILAKSGNLLEGVDENSLESSGIGATDKYKIDKMINSSDLVKPFRREGFPELSTKDMFKFITYTLFENSDQLSDTDKTDFLIYERERFTKAEMLYSLISSAKDIVEFVKEITSFLAKPFTYEVTDSNDKLFDDDTIGKTYTFGEQSGNQTADNILEKYFNENIPKNNVSAFAVLVSSVHCEAKFEGKSVEALFKKHFHDIMTIVKREVVDGSEHLTLGNDGNIYSISNLVYYRVGSTIRKDTVTAAEKASGRWTHVKGKDLILRKVKRNSKAYPPRGGKISTYKNLAPDPGYWTSWDSAQTISERKYNTLSSAEKENYRPWSDINQVKNQGILIMKGVTTSPASVDYSFQLPYIGPGESVSVQALRCTAELDDPEEMATTSKRMSLKGIRRHKTIAGELLRFKYPGTAWIKTFWDSVNFQQAPSRNYLVKLKKVAVPQNYDPDTRTYVGHWNGLFKGQPDRATLDEMYSTTGIKPGEDLEYGMIPESRLEWTDNPAWILLDIMLNNRFGLGRYGMELSDIDKWHLYAAAKFCDELVETGFPLEKPKRYFETENITVKHGQNSYLGHTTEYLDKTDSFYIKVYNDEDKSILETSNFLDEFNFSRKNSKISEGRYLAFFMSDGSVARRRIKSVVEKSLSDAPEVVGQFEAEAQYIELYGPSFIDHNATNKNSKLTTGKVCLEQSYPLVEPRFSCNTYYNRQQTALDIVRELVAQFRTVLNYMAGKISFSIEKKMDPVMMFTDANVSQDGFSYAGASKSTRTTAVKVRYIDKFDDYKTKIEYYEDPGGIDKFGYQEDEIVAMGCTSRGQAQRLAKFSVLAPMLETEVVNFQTGVEGSMLLPGSIIEISDSRRFGENINGRIKEVLEDNYAVKVDKIISNLNFWDPETGKDDDRVELCVMCPLGFEDPGKVRPSSASGFLDEFSQTMKIENARKSQMVYFDGFISGNRREIIRLSRKYRFEVSTSSDVIISNGHELKDGDIIKFSSFGVLPKYSIETVNAQGVSTTIEERISEGTNYHVSIDDPENKSSFKIKKTANGDVLDFVDQGFAMRQNYNSDADLEKNASISGGEHFYSIVKSVDGKDRNRQALQNVFPGSVWSIRGFKKDVFLRAEDSEDVIVRDFISDPNGLNASAVKGVKFSYYSDALGSLVYTGQPTGNDNFLSFRQVGNSGKGLGQIMIDRTDFNINNSYNHIDLISSLGLVKITSARTISVTEDINGVNRVISLFRSTSNTDIFKVLQVTNGQFSALLFDIRGKNFLVNKYENGYYIKLNGLRPSDSEIAKWKEDLVDPEPAPDTTGATPPTNPFKISIDDFRNVGRRQYRVNSVNEIEYGMYDVSASEYNREKFSIIENEISINRPVLPIPPQADMRIPLPPKDLNIEDTTYRGNITYV